MGLNGQLLSVAQSYRSAGVSGYIRQLLLHLPAATPGWQLHAFLPAQPFASPTGWQVHHTTRWDTRRPVQRILWEQLALPAAARSARLDLLHGPVNVNPLFSACPSVVTIHDLSFMRYPQAFPPLKRAYLRRQVQLSVRAARRVIAISKATQHDLVTLFGVDPARIDVVYNGVDAAFSAGAPHEVEEFRARRGLPARYILHLGTLEPRKNLTRLVQAFARLKAQDTNVPHLKLVLAGGKGWFYDSLFAEVARLGLEGSVLFPGYIDDADLVGWYRAAAVFAYPSLMEGFGLPVLEALASGVPTVTSNVSSLPEVAGDAALLVDPSDVDALAAALGRLLQEPALAAELRSRGLRRAARFSWQRTAQETAAVYRRTLQPRGEGVV